MFRLWLIPVVSSPLTFPGQAHGSWGLVSAVMACIYAGFHISITATAAEIGGFKMKLKLESGYRVCMRKHIWIPVEKVLGGGSCIRSADWQVLRSGVKVGATSGPATSRALAKWFSSGGRIRDIRFEEVFHNSLIINDSSLEILMSHKWCIGLWWGRSTITSLNVTGLFIHGNKVFVIINVSWYLAIKSAVEMSGGGGGGGGVHSFAPLLCAGAVRPLKMSLSISPFISCCHLLLLLAESLLSATLTEYSLCG